MNCPNGWNAPSVGYQNGCRCGRCQGWRDGQNMRRREATRARRLGRRRPVQPQMPWNPHSATSFYRDALDDIDGKASAWL